MKTNRGIVFTVVVAGIFLFMGAPRAQASHGTHLVISQVQITGGAGLTKNDFVELYNPTGAPVDLNGMRLVKRTATATSDTTVKSWIEATLMPAHGFYLWANSDFTTIAATPDAKTIQTIADDNGIALRQGAENSGVIIDAVSWGTGASAFIEGVAFSQNPGVNQSIERKPGGSDGNGTDTGNNTSDFFLQTVPNPKNISSAVAPPVSAPSVLPPPSPSPAPDPVPLPHVINSGDVVVNEFMSDPDNGVEWVELYNKTSTAIDLAGWKLLDGGGDSIASLSGIIFSFGFLVFDRTGAHLNNSGDHITLNAPSGAVIDAVSYGDWNDGNVADNAPVSAKAGQAVARKSNGGDTGYDAGDFVRTETPTKNAPNVITITAAITTSVGSSPTPMVAIPSAKIVINEFVSNPEEGQEWIELYNAGTTSVELDGWYIEEGSEAKTKLQGLMIPGRFKVIQDIAGNLNNKGDIIRLKNEKGEVIDRVTYGVWEDGIVSDNAPNPEDPFSAARRKDGEDTDNDKDDFVITAKVTKGKANMIEDPQKSGTERTDTAQKNQKEEVIHSSAGTNAASVVVPDTAGKLYVSEIMPDPDGADSEEWFELFWGGDAPLNLKEFILDDKEGGSSPFLLGDTVIAPGTYRVFKKLETKLTLNNDSDAVRIRDPRGKVIDSVEYEDVQKGQAYARTKEGGWQWTEKATPGAENVFVETEPQKSATERGEIVEADIDEVRDMELGTKVRVRGAVTATPGMFGAQVFYAGMQIYMYKKDFPKMRFGDIVQITGVVAESSGERRIKVVKQEDMEVTGHEKPPNPRETTAADIDEDVEGTLVKIAGTIIDTAKSSITIDDGSGEIIAAFKPGAEIDAREFAPGVKISLTGIVGHTKNGYRVMPRVQEDIEILGREEIKAVGTTDNGQTSATAAPHPYAKATATAGGGLALASLGIRRRKMFVTGIRAAWFTIRQGFKSGGGGNGPGLA